MERHILDKDSEVQEAYQVVLDMIRDAFKESERWGLHEQVVTAIERNRIRIQQEYNQGRLTDEFKERLKFVLGGTKHYEDKMQIPQAQRPAWDSGGQRNDEIQFNAYKFMFEQEAGIGYEDFKTRFHGNLDELLTFFRSEAEGRYSQVISSHIMLDETEEEMLEGYGNEIAVLIMGASILSHQAREPEITFRRIINDIPSEEMDSFNQQFEGLVNKILDVYEGNKSLLESHLPQIAQAVAHYYYEEYYTPFQEGARGEDSFLTRNSDLYSGDNEVVIGPGLYDGLVGISLAGDGQKITLIDNNAFVAEVLRSFARLTGKGHIQIFGEDIETYQLSADQTRMADRVILKQVLHEIGRSRSGIFEGEINQEGQTELISLQAVNARSRTYERIRGLLKPGGQVVIQEALELTDVDQKSNYGTLIESELEPFGFELVNYDIVRDDQSKTSYSQWIFELKSDGKESDVGGIDLNPNMLELQTQGTGIDFNIPFDSQSIQSIQIDGFSPVIFRIIPTNLSLLMGVNETEEAMQTSSTY